jgi:hypothetical protein
MGEEAVMDNRGVADKRAAVVAVVAGLIAGVKVAPGDPERFRVGAHGFDQSLGIRLRLPARWSRQASEATMTVTMCN